MRLTEARKSFDDDISALQADLQDMGNVVDKMLGITIEAFVNGNSRLTRQVEEMDDIVDNYNITIENDALHLLALQQPMAKDLRTIAAVMKIITDVERAGDYVVDIAEIVENLSKNTLFKPLVDIPKMALLVREMLKETLTAFVTRDLNKVDNMIKLDEEVDALYHKLYNELTDIMKERQDITEQAMGLILIARYLERMADHITNIGERIYYMQTGVIKELHN